MINISPVLAFCQKCARNRENVNHVNRFRAFCPLNPLWVPSLKVPATINMINMINISPVLATSSKKLINMINISHVLSTFCCKCAPNWGNGNHVNRFGAFCLWTPSLKIPETINMINMINMINISSVLAAFSKKLINVINISIFSALSSANVLQTGETMTFFLFGAQIGQKKRDQNWSCFFCWAKTCSFSAVFKRSFE